MNKCKPTRDKIKAEESLKKIINNRLREKGFFIDLQKRKKACDFMIEEMEKGLRGKKSSLAMLPSFIPFAGQPLKDQELVVIEQGGTNLRAAKCQIAKGVPKLGEIICEQAPGSGRKWQVGEFFESLIKKTKPVLKSKTKIGFVFSYEIKMEKNGDGRLLAEAKDLNVPGLVGKLVGDNLRKHLLKAGFEDCKVTVLNDAVAALLSGKRVAKNWESLIGLIVATGTNAAYVENKEKILKEQGLVSKREIINIESGQLDISLLGISTDYDKAVDRKSKIPGDCPFEKMISGGYVDKLLKVIVKDLSKRGVLDKKINRHWLKKVTSKEMGELIKAGVNQGLKQKYINRGDLSKLELNTLSCLSKMIFRRSACLIGVTLAGIIKKMNFGKKANQSLGIVIEGPLYWEIPGYSQWVNQSLEEILGKRNIKFFKVKNPGLIGAAYAAALRF